ncbi:MAG TPA: pyruvate carboxyltransferase [Thermodesulfobacteriota bacterium]|nr:pyruvate carboxyltransferase [Thermodesulfobacteriota bacterium]
MARENQPWQTKNWFVSPWNYLKEVTEGFTPPARIKFHDNTVRDGEQQAGLMFRKEEKIQIAEKLAEAGVHRIEAGTPAVSPHDEAAIREIVKRKLGPEIICLSRCMEEDIRRAADCGVDGVNLSIPGSKLLLEQAYGWTVDKGVEVAIKGTKLAHELGLYIIFAAVDGTRADFDWYTNLIKRIATEGHIDSLCLMDTIGSLTPEAVAYSVRTLLKRIGKPIEAHFHQDFGLSVANSIKAVLCGAEVIQSTVNGIGERCGNTPMEETVLALRTLYGIDTGIKCEKLREVAKLVEQITKIPMTPNRGVVGDRAYCVESGMVFEEYRNIAAKQGPDLAKVGLFPVHHAFVGNKEPQAILGKKSGRGSVIAWAEKLGIELGEDEITDVLMAVKAKAYEKRGELNEADFREIVEGVKARSPQKA